MQKQRKKAVETTAESGDLRLWRSLELALLIQIAPLIDGELCMLGIETKKEAPQEGHKTNKAHHITSWDRFAQSYNRSKNGAT